MKRHKKLTIWAITSSLAGFLFGFDTVVISGAETQIQNLWALSGSMHGWALSAALWGTVLGALFGGIPTKKYGRKKTLVSIGLLYFISALGSAFAQDVTVFILARFIGGVGVGASTIAAPLFISEIAPNKDRGKLTGLFQFNIVFGILVAYFSNYFIASTFDPDVAWRWMLGVEALPALIYFTMAFSLPESPRWLISHANKKEEGIAIFRKINPDMDESQLQTLAKEIENSEDTPSQKTKFWTKRYSVPILLAIMIAMFNQLSGINIILYFAPRLLDLAGGSNPMASSVSLGVTNLIFTFIGLWLIDKLGRKSLLYIGSFGYILSLGICAIVFLSIPEIKVVSSAIDLENASYKVIQVEKNIGFRTEKDKETIYKEFEEAKLALSETTNLPDYNGGKVEISQSNSTNTVKTIAEATKGEASKLLGGISWLVLICIIFFIAAHAIGQGAVIWVFISEIFPNEHRAIGQSVGSFTHWFFAALLTFLFPLAIKHIDTGYIFAFFAIMMILQLIWVKTMVPETKGKKLEEIKL